MKSNKTNLGSNLLIIQTQNASLNFCLAYGYKKIVIIWCTKMILFIYARHIKFVCAIHIYQLFQSQNFTIRMKKVKFFV